MILDALNLFSDAQAITASAASTNTIDLGVARDIGIGKTLYLSVTVDTAFTDAGSDSTVTVIVETDDADTFGSATQTTLFTIPALAARGNKYFAKISPGVIAERYVRLYYTVTNGNLTTGALTAGFVPDIDKQINYPKGYTIS